MAGARRSKVVIVLFLVGVLCGMGWGPVHAEEGGANPDAKTEEPHWVISIRGGVAQATQDHVSNAAASLGGAGSLQFLYQFSPYFRFGLTVDGQQQAVDVKNGAGTFGDLLTVAVMPTVEMRPFQTTTAIPYLSVGLGMNFNMFSTATRVLPLDYGNTFAARIAGGLDIPLTPHWSLNTELAWRLNKGDWTQMGMTGRFDATSVLGLVGIRYMF